MIIKGPDNQAQDLKYQINQYLSEILIVTLADVTHDAGISKLELKCAIAVWYAEVLPPGMLATRFET